MKKVVLLLLSFMLLLSSCSTLPLNSVPPSESGESGADYPKSPLSQEELTEINDYIHENFEKGFSQTEQNYELTKQVYEELGWGESNHYNYPYWRDLGSDRENAVYHPSSIVEQLKPGMFSDEVREVLGTPHFNSVFIPGSEIRPRFERVTYDAFALHILQTGEILALRYVPVFIGDYEREELAEHIGDLHLYETKYHPEYRFLKLASAEVLTKEELSKIPWLGTKSSREKFQTAQEYLPAHVKLEDLKAVKIGMTYSEVKALVGSSGYDCVDVSENYEIFYGYPLLDSEEDGLIYYELRSDELVVTKITLPE
ncbi:MAG: hypothetical protein IJZ37_01250 [Clostridia bacterium]|nr:hypothetical protein [Clostridia bacterium]